MSTAYPRNFPAELCDQLDAIAAKWKAANKHGDCKRCEHLGGIVSGHNECKAHRCWTTLIGTGYCLDDLDAMHEEHNAAIEAWRHPERKPKPKQVKRKDLQLQLF